MAQKSSALRYGVLGAMGAVAAALVVCFGADASSMVFAHRSRTLVTSDGRPVAPVAVAPLDAPAPPKDTARIAPRRTSRQARRPEPLPPLPPSPPGSIPTDPR
jgi:hypothetical protein